MRKLLTFKVVLGDPRDPDWRSIALWQAESCSLAVQEVIALYKSHGIHIYIVEAVEHLAGGTQNES